MGMCADGPQACPQCRAYYDRVLHGGDKEKASRYEAAVDVAKRLGLSREERRRAGLTRSRARKRGIA